MKDYNREDLELKVKEYEAMVYFLTSLGDRYIGVSSGICGSTTYGYGKLDANGYWEYPVPAWFYEEYKNFKLVLTQ